jgi:hypothetical protein
MLIKTLRYKSYKVHGARTSPVRNLCPWSGLVWPVHSGMQVPLIAVALELRPLSIFIEPSQTK